MRRGILSLLLVLFLVGLVGGADWSAAYNFGPQNGFRNPGPILAKGFEATYAPTDVPGTFNGWAQIGIQTISAAESSDDDQWCTGVAVNNTTNLLLRSSGAGSSSFLAQPDVTRNIIATLSQSATVALKLTGTDIAGTAITENITISAGTTGASTKAFKTVTRVDGYKSAGTNGILKLGTGNLLGLNTVQARDTVLMCYVNGVKESTAPSVTFSSSVLSLNTIDTNSAPGGYATVVYLAVS
jgi:hypothetical protein